MGSAGHGAEAVAAVDGLVAARLEGHPSDAATVGAGHLVHLTRATESGVAATSAVGGAPGRPAAGATRGRIGEAARGVELLLTLRPNEIDAAVAAPQGLVYRHAPCPPSGALIAAPGW